jgi:membrane-bound serine protease (ClpP class)
MKFLILVGILVLTITLSLAIVIALYRHKKASSGSIHVVGETGEVASDLAPEGTVIVHGELWRARSGDGSTVVAETRVQVVGIDGLLLVVDPSE